MFLYKIDIHTVIIKETVLWNIVRWHCKTVVYVSMLCSTEPTKKHSVLMSLLVNGEDPPTGYSVRKPQQHQVRSWVSLTLPYPFQKKGGKDLGPFKAHCFNMIGNDLICNILAVSQLFTDHGPTEEMFLYCMNSCFIPNGLFTLSERNVNAVTCKKKKSLKKKLRLFLL